jgi:hypothetical protein
MPNGGGGIGPPRMNGGMRIGAPCGNHRSGGGAAPKSAGSGGGHWGQPGPSSGGGLQTKQANGKAPSLRRVAVDSVACVQRYMHCQRNRYELGLRTAALET